MDAMKYNDLRDFLTLLEQQGELKRITLPVDPHLEITEIADRTLRAGGRLFVHTQLRWCRCAGVAIMSLFRAEARVQTMAHPDTTGLSPAWSPAVLLESGDNLS